MRLFFLLLAVAFLFVASPILAGEQITLPEKKITVDIKKAGARKALAALLENSGLRYNLSSDVTDDIKVNIEAKKTKWSDVFTALLAQARLIYHISPDGTIQVAPAAAEQN